MSEYPTDAANFPLLQRCPFGYLNRALGCALKKRYALLPLRICSAQLGIIVKESLARICKWSGITLISTISMLCSFAAFLIQAVIKFLYSNLLNILYLYFGHHSKCQKLSPTECLFRVYSKV